MLLAPPGPDTPAEAKLQFDLSTLIGNASWPIKLTVTLLLLSSVAVWVIGVLKIVQLSRLSDSENAFERSVRRVNDARELQTMAVQGASPGARVVTELCSRKSYSLDRLRSVADRAIVDEQRQARSLLSPLGSIAASAPFIGLFGTVYGIMDAFVRIGESKSASLPVVAPAIGEALVTTAIGLVVAIPAVVFYNAIEKRVGDFAEQLEAAAAEWVVLIAERKSTGATTPPPAMPPARER